MNHAIIVAAGSGTRLNRGKNKAFVELLGKPVVVYTLTFFQQSPQIRSIILVAKKENISEAQACIQQYQLTKVTHIIEGGKERQDSVFAGLKALQGFAQPDDYVVIHNSSNIFITNQELETCLTAAQQTGAAVVGWKVKDTLKKSNPKTSSPETNLIEQTLPRENLWHVQTPQIIRYAIALQAFETAQREGFYGTDDVQLVERLGYPVKLVECSSENFKITTPADLRLAETLLRAQQNCQQNCHDHYDHIQSSYRVGFGQDSHRFAEKEKPLVLAGVLVQNHNGLEANSDGDVVLHALFNALSQSIGGKSIGYYCDAFCEQGITDSKEYMNLVINLLYEKGYKINNLGIMIECKTPKIDPLVDAMKHSLGALLHIEEHAIGITATSGEGLTDFGRGLGIQCFVSVSVVKP